jgi:Carboxypeptidase regulatory-like domain/TonB-dependent Receptor Plug Domain/TonB dependent receptor
MPINLPFQGSGTRARSTLVQGSIVSLRWGFAFTCLALMLSLLGLPKAAAQVDQGAVTGVVQDNSGASVLGATVKLINADTQLELDTTSNASGIYVFSPVKIGNYTVSVSATGFETTIQQNIQVHLGERVSVPLSLRPGGVNETVTISTAPPLLQTESAAVGQEISTKMINETPLANGNWVYMAQLTPGVVPSYGTRGGGTGDFEANGQKAEQNNYILNGVDNNISILDYVNGSSYAIAPPPEALSEFKVETANSSSEYGHSAGGVLNASIKSGTNQIHGALWESFRNTHLNAQNWNSLVIPPFHENQFGATLGFPLLKNKLFYFGDIQNTRIAYGATNTYSTPTTKMRQGDFSELLNTNLTGSSCPIYLYQPNSNTGAYAGGACKTVPATGTLLVNSSGQQNVFNPAQINPVAQRVLNLYPLPNANGGETFNNLVENLATHYNPVQWDQRLDWNPSPNDQAYSVFSYQHVVQINTAPLGPILDGTPNFIGQHDNYLTENFMISETHEFSPRLVNEFRFAFNYGKFSNLQENANTDVAATLGMNGMPFSAGPNNGGIPQFSVSGVTGFGSHGNDPALEGQNVLQILDNVSLTAGNHSIKTGINFQNIRYYNAATPSTRGNYTFNGTYTGVTGVSNTGYGVADFLSDQLSGASISNFALNHHQQAYIAAYVEDNWRVSDRLTLNLGVRYDYFQPQQEVSSQWANFVPTSMKVGTGTGLYEIPRAAQNAPISPAFQSMLTQDNISLQYVDSPRISNFQKLNFAPRLGLEWRVEPRTVVRTGFSIFYGLLQPGGGAGVIQNYPFLVSSALSNPACSNGTMCPSLAAQSATLENGLSTYLASGIGNFVSFPAINSQDQNLHTPYTMSYNFSVQHALSNNLSATLAYVGNGGRHLATLISSDPPMALLAPGANTKLVQSFPHFTNSTWWSDQAMSSYNALEATLEKRYARGFSFLANYTWAHSLDNSVDPLGGGVSYRDTGLIPIGDEYTQSNYDVRQRVTFNGGYELPFGRGRAHLNNSTLADLVVGGWSGNATFSAQSGMPFTVGTSNISTASGGGARAIKVRDPFSPGGSPDPSNPSVTCPTTVRTTAHWYNPCAFANPLPGNTISSLPAQQLPNGTSMPMVTSAQQAIAYLGGRSNTVVGPGYQRVNASLFKSFHTWREQSFDFRVDAFNLLNHPTHANPSDTSNGNSGGRITSPLNLQSNTTDARFFQLGAKYLF